MPISAPTVSSAATALFDQPHATVRAALAAGAPLFIPVNPVEFHGPHLSLHNDHLLSVGLARDLHAALWPEHPLLIARDLELGVDPCPGPGTRYAQHPTVRRAVLAAAQSAYELGAKIVVFMTFHGSPLHAVALDAGVQWLRRRGLAAVDPFNAVTGELAGEGDLADTLGPLAPVVAHLPPAEAEAVLAGLRMDFHAGFFETSLALHYAPASVDPRHTELPPCPPVPPVRPLRWLAALAGAVGARRLAGELRFAAEGMGWYHLRPFPGYSSRPSAASAAAGAVLAARIVEGQAQVIRDALAGRPTPRPLLGWTRWVLLGGRVGSPRVPVDQVALPWDGPPG